jgi:pimeloyl-ACP methyl ester carboxylesterase
MNDLYCHVRGHGRPVFFLHGFGNDHRAMLPLDEAFQGGPPWQRYYLDLPGMGASPGGPEIDGSDAVVRAVRKLVLGKAGDQAFALVGYSWGGLIARRLAFDLQDQSLGLALICPVADARRDRRRLAERRPDQDRQMSLESLSGFEAAEFEKSGFAVTPEAWEAFRSHLLPGALSYDRSAVSRIAAQYELSSAPEADGAQYTKPTLFCLGANDHIVGFRDQLDLARHYPATTVAVLDGAGHPAHLERPAVVTALLRDWIVRMS